MSKPALIGTAPDSWGVWFPEDPQQTTWERFLDEATVAGYTRIELGPYGFLPTDPHQLRDELAKRDLTLTAGTIFEHLHRPDSWDSTWADVSASASLTAAMGAKHLVVIPAFCRDERTGEVLEEPNLTAEQWPLYAKQIDRLRGGHRPRGDRAEHDARVHEAIAVEADGDCGRGDGEVERSAPPQFPIRAAPSLSARQLDAGENLVGLSRQVVHTVVRVEVFQGHFPSAAHGDE